MIVEIKFALYTFFCKQRSCEGSNVKNGLNFKQLDKQPPTLKTLSSLKLNFFTIVFGTT